MRRLIMTRGEQIEVATIERKAEEMISILSAYIYGRVLSVEESHDLNWIRDRIFAVCRDLFHDKFSTSYRLTQVERPFFMNNAERYLMGNAIPFSNIQNGERCGMEVNFAIYTLVDYLNNIARECRVAEHNGILPKEESFDVEY